MFGNKKIDAVLDYRFIDRDKIQAVEDVKVIFDYMRLFDQALPYHPKLENYFKPKPTE